jgi:hypothetical protein
MFGCVYKRHISSARTPGGCPWILWDFHRLDDPWQAVPEARESTDGGMPAIPGASVPRHDPGPSSPWDICSLPICGSRRRLPTRLRPQAQLAAQPAPRLAELCSGLRSDRSCPKPPTRPVPPRERRYRSEPTALNADYRASHREDSPTIPRRPRTIAGYRINPMADLAVQNDKRVQRATCRVDRASVPPRP